jgi:hypothetical protein
MPQIKYPQGPTEDLSPMMTVVFQYFAEEDWPAEKLEGDDLVRAAFEGENGQWACFVQVDESESYCLFYSVAPLEVPVAKRPAMAEFIARANYNIPIGGFELDFDDGEVRFKTSIDVTDDRLSVSLFRSLAINNLAMMDQFLPSLKAVIESDRSATDILMQLED